jgi:deazaflavin-dependent oxidoreductase (nitroreductase family)
VNPGTTNPIIRFAVWIYTGLYRLTNGKIGGSIVGLKVLLLSTRGRRTGLERTKPLCYFEDGPDYVVIASNGGADKHPDWFFNLESDPDVRVRIRNSEFSAKAEVSDTKTRQRLWDKLISLSPYYIRYGNKTWRQIPMILLHPVRS